MEYFKPPEFGNGREEDSSASSEILESYAEADESSDRAERFVPNILEERQKRGVKRKKVDYSRFNSAEFNEVDTLLTNVEDYSKRIREDVEKYAQNVQNEADLFRSETELELANALIKRIEAEKKAEEILKNAEESRDQIRDQAYQEGFEAGFEDGKKQHQEENEANTGNITTLLEEMKKLRLSMLQKYEEQFVRLCLLIAEKVVHKELTTGKEFVLDILKKTVQHFEGQGNVKIRLNPVEFDFIAAHQSELEKYCDEDQMLYLKADEKVHPGSPVMESDFSVVDLSLDKQFREIEEQLELCVDDRRALFSSTQ